MTSRTQAEEYIKKYERVFLLYQLGMPLRRIGMERGVSGQRIRMILMQRERYVKDLEKMAIHESNEISGLHAIRFSRELSFDVP